MTSGIGMVGGIKDRIVVSESSCANSLRRMKFVLLCSFPMTIACFHVLSSGCIGSSPIPTPIYLMRDLHRESNCRGRAQSIPRQLGRDRSNICRFLKRGLAVTLTNFPAIVDLVTKMPNFPP